MWGPHVVEGSMAACYQQDKGYFQVQVPICVRSHYATSGADLGVDPYLHILLPRYVRF